MGQEEPFPAQRLSGREGRTPVLSFMIHVRHADAAIPSGLRETVLITQPLRTTNFDTTWCPIWILCGLEKGS